MGFQGLKASEVCGTQPLRVVHRLAGQTNLVLSFALMKGKQGAAHGLLGGVVNERIIERESVQRLQEG